MMAGTEIPLEVFDEVLDVDGQSEVNEHREIERGGQTEPNDEAVGIRQKIAHVAQGLGSMMPKRFWKSTSEKQSSSEVEPLEQALAANDALHEQRLQSTRTISQMEKEIEEMRREIIELQTQLAVPESEQLAILKRELAEKDQQIVDKQALLDRHVRGEGRPYQEIAEELKQKEALLAAKNSAHQVELARVRALKTTLEEKRKMLNHFKKKSEDLAEQLEKHNSDAGTSTGLNSEKDSKISVSETAPGHSDTNSDDSDNGFEVIDKSEAAADNEALLKELAAKNSEIETLRQENDRLLIEVKQSEEALGGLQTNLQNTQPAVAQLADIKKVHKAQSRQMASLRQELEATAMSREEHEEYMRSMSEQIRGAEEHSKRLEEALKSVEEDKEVLEKAFTDTKKELQGRIHAYKRQDEASQEKLARYLKKIENQQAQIDQFIPQIEDLQNKLGIATAEAELYKEDFETERQDRAKAHGLKEDMRQACEQRVNAMTAHFESEKKVFEETIVKLTRQLEGAHDETDKVKQTHDLRLSKAASAKQIKDLEEQLYEATQKAIAAKDEVLTKTAQVKSYSRKNTELQNELAAVTQEHDMLKQEMDKIRDEIARIKREGDATIEKERKDCQATIAEERKNNKKVVDTIQTQMEVLKNKNSKLSKTNKLSHPELREQVRKLLDEKEQLQVQFDEEKRKLEDDKQHLLARCDELQAEAKEVDAQFSRMKVKHLELKKSSRESLTQSTPPPENTRQPSKPPQVNGRENGPPYDLRGRASSDYQPVAQDGPRRGLQKQGNFSHSDLPLRASDPDQQTVPGNMFASRPSNFPPQSYAQSNMPPQARLLSPQGNAQLGSPVNNPGWQQPQAHTFPSYPPQNRQQFAQGSQGIYQNTNTPAYSQMGSPQYPQHAAPDNYRSQFSSGYKSLPESPLALPYSRPDFRANKELPHLVPKAEPPPLVPMAEPPKPKPRRQAQKVEPPEEIYNPNATQLLIQRDELTENIDNEIKEAALGVINAGQDEALMEEAPLDPNLVCPMCMKQYHIGQIQLFRAHVGKCDGST